MSRRTIAHLGVLSLSIALAASCREQPRPARNQTERNAVIAFHRGRATELHLQANLTRLASGALPLDTIPRLVPLMCNQQCDAAYFQCVKSRIPPPQIPGSDHRAPKEFPVTVVECTEHDPDCGNAQIVSQPEIKSCEDARAACQQACDCRPLARPSSPGP